MSVQHRMVSVKSSGSTRSSTVVYLSVRSLIPFFFGHILEVMVLAVVLVELATVYFRVLHILVLYLPLHGISPHLPPRIITLLLNVLRQPQHILHVLHVRRYSVAYLVQGICHLVLDVVPEPGFALALLGALGYELLYSVIESHRVLVHTFLHIGSQFGIHRIV